MLPTFELGPWHIRTYGLMVALAVLIMALIGFHRLRQLKVPASTIIRGGAPIFFAGLVVGYAVYYLPKLPHFIRTGTLGPGEGPSITWGLVGAVIMAVISCRKYRVSLGRAFDLGILACPLGQAVARLGCLAAACCYGYPTDSWLGVYLPDQYGIWSVRYPTQLMHSAANLFIFFVLLAVERYGRRRPDKLPGSRIWPFDGFIFLLFLNLFFLQRFVIAFFRVEPPSVFGPFSWMHFHSIIGMGIATVLIVLNLVRSSAVEKAHDSGGRRDLSSGAVVRVKKGFGPRFSIGRILCQSCQRSRRLRVGCGCCWWDGSSLAQLWAGHERSPAR
jgi:phosphatidylglycerol:prolipoprotein diacylglycerol transferase